MIKNIGKTALNRSNSRQKSSKTPMFLAWCLIKTGEKHWENREKSDGNRPKMSKSPMLLIAKWLKMTKNPMFLGQKRYFRHPVWGARVTDGEQNLSLRIF